MDYIDYQAYGKDIAERDNVRFTSHGCVIENKDMVQESSMDICM